jgi:hypothetical protein
MNDQASISRLKKLAGINLDSDNRLMEKSNIDMIVESNYGPILKSKKDQLASVQKNGLSIYYFKNPDLDVQIAAVKENSLAMLYIKNPSPKLFTNPSVKTSVIRTLLLRVKSGETIDVILEYLDRHQVDWPELETIRSSATRKPVTESRDINSMSEREQIEAVKQNPYEIRYIKNPSLQVQLAAVKKRGYSIRYIQNPSLEVQLAAVKQEITAIQDISNPNEQVQLFAVRENGFAIVNIKNPGLEAQIAAVKQDTRSIFYIPEPSPKLFDNPAVKTSVIRALLTGLKSDESIEDILDYLARHQVDWDELKKIREAMTRKPITPINESRDLNSMSEEEQVEYVRFNWRDIRHIHNPSERVQRAAVYLDMSALELIKNPAPSVQKYAILSNPFAFKYIKTVSSEVSEDPEVKHLVITYLLKLLKSDEAPNLFLYELINIIDNHNLSWPELEVIKSAAFKKQIDDK